MWFTSSLIFFVGNAQTLVLHWYRAYNYPVLISLRRKVVSFRIDSCLSTFGCIQYPRSNKNAENH